MSAPPAGLCNLCTYQRVVGNTRGSRFSMCERGVRTGERERYPKYPRIPVVECPGFEPCAASPSPPPSS